VQKILFSCKFVVPSHSVKKNGKQISFNKSTGKRFLRSNDKALFYEKWLTQKLMCEKLKQRIDTINEPVILKLQFYFPESKYYTKKNIVSKNLADISNLYESPQDALQKAGIIENDRLVEGHDGSRRIPIKDNAYYLEITIYSVE